jgi:hypothetical protein
MRILKEKTVPLSCRVSEKMKSQIEDMADALQLSLAQYVSILVVIGQTGEDGLKELQDKLAAACEKQLKMQIELEKLSPLQSTAFAKPLANLIQNELILQTLYEKHEKRLIDKNELIKLDFQTNTILQAKLIDGATFYFMGSYGWSYTDAARKFITIRKVKQ